MSSAQDPFYIVKEEIQESIDRLLSTFRQWELIPSNIEERIHLTKEIVPGCESIQWQVDELDKAIAVAARDPSWYGIDEIELEKRRRWTSTARNQVSVVKKAVEAGKVLKNLASTSVNGTPQELMKLPNGRPYKADRSDQYIAKENDDFISSETDRQMLLIKKSGKLPVLDSCSSSSPSLTPTRATTRQQDEELDELSDSMVRIGGIGLTIHEELSGQERIIDELSLEMDSTSNRLDFVQKKVAMVMKKAGVKGQIMMITFLIILFIILFVLVFFT